MKPEDKKEITIFQLMTHTAGFNPAFWLEAPSDLRTVLPDYVCDALAEALPYFGRKIKGFDTPDRVLTAVESRSTCPVRILRDEGMESLPGLYPIGEGAGYAGGIISAAIDGIKCAETIVTKQKQK